MSPVFGERQFGSATITARLVTVGTSTTTIRAVKLALPAPVSAGIRVAAWTRPVFQPNLRFTRWTAAG